MPAKQSSSLFNPLNSTYHIAIQAILYVPLSKSVSKIFWRLKSLIFSEKKTESK